MNKVHIGIDPGKDGFISVLTEDGFEFHSIPKIGKVVDIHMLSHIFHNIYIDSSEKRVHCVMEDVHAIFGSSAGSTFEFGFVNGVLEALLVSIGIPYTKIQPKEWQKQMFKGVDLMKRPSSTGKTFVNDTKAMALVACKRLFPELDLTATERSNKPHDGKVDSILLCEYSRRNYD